MLYYSLVYPYLQYCHIVWGNAKPTFLKPLLLKQKKVLRLINNVGFIEATNPLFKENKILKLPDIYNIEAAKFVHEQISIANPVIEFRQANAIHNYPTRRNSQLRPPLPLLDLDKRFIKYSGCLIYNALPNNLKSLRNIHTLKINVKKLLINKY